MPDPAKGVEQESIQSCTMTIFWSEPLPVENVSFQISEMFTFMSHINLRFSTGSSVLLVTGLLALGLSGFL